MAQVDSQTARAELLADLDLDPEDIAVIDEHDGWAMIHERAEEFRRLAEKMR